MATSPAVAAIHSALEGLADLPTCVHAWVIREGLDATDDPAVWIWAIIDEDDLTRDTSHELKSLARATSRAVAPDLWPYVLIRGRGEPRPEA